LRAKEPDELVQLQTEFMSQQAQIFAEQTKELGQKIQNATQAAYTTLADAARKTEQSITRGDQSLKRAATEGFTLDTSNQAMIELATPGDSPPTASTSQTSLFQMNLSAIRAERYIGGKVLRSDAVAKVTGAGYVGGSPA
jgi:hypothetical protein